MGLFGYLFVRPALASAISRLFFNPDFCRDPLKQGSILSSFMGIL